jgi:hypothetical protein
MFYADVHVLFKAYLVSDEEKYVKGCKLGMFHPRPARVSYAARGYWCILYTVFTFLCWISSSASMCLLNVTVLHIIRFICVFLCDSLTQ